MKKGIEDREYICEQLSCFGVKLDKELNNGKNIERKVSTEDSKNRSMGSSNKRGIAYSRRY